MVAIPRERIRGVVWFMKIWWCVRKEWATSRSQKTLRLAGSAHGHEGRFCENGVGSPQGRDAGDSSSRIQCCKETLSETVAWQERDGRVANRANLGERKGW